jgi:Bacterial SH3 domain
MAEDRKPLLLVGLGLAAYAGVQLLQKPKPAPAPAPITCPAGYHVEGAVCVQDPAPPLPSPATGYRVTATAGLIVRAGPGTQYASRGLLQYGQVVSIVCQTTGQRIINSAIWDQLSGPIAGYVSDWYVSTPNVGRYSPGLAVCGGAGPPAPAPGPGTLPPTGRPALSSLGQIVARMVISTGCGWGDADYIVLARLPTATASPPFGRVWIRDKITWDALGIPRAAINIVTPGLLLAMADAGTLQKTVIRNYGDAWTWSGRNFLGQTLWDTAMQQINRGPFSVLKAPAGWCS